MSVPERKALESIDPFRFDGQAAAVVFTHALEGIMITDRDGTICYINPAFTRITGYGEEILGRRPHVLSSGHHDRHFYQGIWTSLQETGHWQGDIWNRRKNGQIFPEWLSIYTLGADHYVALFWDLTIQKQSERAVHLTNYDILTELPNQALLMDRLTLAVAHASRNQQNFAVVAFSVDRFKYFNNSLGHKVGDQLLKQIAQRLSKSFREDDTIARIGGAEFVIVFHELKSLETISKLTHKLVELLRLPFFIDGQELYITVSVGIAVFPADGRDGEKLLNHADAAMYRAIEQGGNQYEMFTPRMNEIVMERLALEHGLRKALAKEEFELFYQPQINVLTGRIVGTEALLRWHSPELGLMPPSKFIPVAEDTGLIIPIGEWVLRKAMMQNVAWRNMGYAPLRMAVNLSGKQFRQTNLVGKIARMLEETGLDPSLLELEITESVAMHDVEFTVETLRALKEMGVRIAIDDFGTGYSSLNYLQKFPINTLKIDSAFISQYTRDEDTAIITTILHLAQTLRYSAIAEGVETWEQYYFLEKNSCDEIQGYLFCRPIPQQEMTALLAELQPDLIYRKRA